MFDFLDKYYLLKKIKYVKMLKKKTGETNGQEKLCIIR